MSAKAIPTRGDPTWTTDPIRWQGVGEIARADFHGFLGRRLAGPWLRMLALEKAIRVELSAAGRALGSRELRSRIRRWVRRDGILREWQPAPSAVAGAEGYRSGKAELDLTRCLANLWVLRGDGDRPKDAASLVALFAAEVERREPVITHRGGECDEQVAGPEEVYPDLLALTSEAHRRELLEQALRAGTAAPR